MFNFYNSTLRIHKSTSIFQIPFFFMTGTAKARYFFCNSVKKHSIEMSRIFSTERTPSRSNWNLEMLVLKTEDKPEVPGEILSVQEENRQQNQSIQTLGIKTAAHSMVGGELQTA